MVVGIKDAAKLVGITVIVFCAVLVCTMFLNYHIDVVSTQGEITSPQALEFYHAQVATAKVVCLVSGGCLLLTSVIMLFFYIKHYIDTHKKELGILKALGYSNRSIAKNFWVFGLSVFFGAALGFAASFLIMPSFYNLQNEEKLLPELTVHFHPALLVYLVVLPSIVFAITAIGYASFKLKKPVLGLLRETMQTETKNKKHKTQKPTSFLADLKRNTGSKTLTFFIVFASFCFSSMTQMSISMKDLSSVMMGAMIMLIGIVLACTTLFLAVTTVIHGNTKTIAMMRVFGYCQKDCCKALLGRYRPMAYVGFAIGTVYQYVLLRVMVDIVFKGIAGVPEYRFDFPVMMITLVLFAVIYELVMYYYAERIKKISVKEIMLES